MGDLGRIPGSGRSPGGGHGNPLRYSCLENLYGKKNLAGCSPWGRKESDTTERLSTTHNGVITFFSWSIVDLRCSFCRTAKWFSYMYICILFYVLWKIDLFIFWLLWVFIAACGLSLVLASGGFCFLWCAGFSLWGLRLLQSSGSRCVGFSSCSSRALEHWLSSLASRHVRSSWTKDRTRVPCIAWQILNHWTTREALFFIFFSIMGLLQDIEYSSQRYAVEPCCLSILYITVCVC